MASYTVDVYASQSPTIIEATPTENFSLNSKFGKGTPMAGINRCILQFDLATALMAYSGVTVTSAELHVYWYPHLYVVGYACHAYRLVPAIAPLGVTYNTFDGSNAWPGSAGAHTAGLDYTTAGSVAFVTPGAGGGAATITGFANQVTAALGSSLYTLLLTDVETVENVYHIGEYYSANVAERPFMRVTFTANQNFELGAEDTLIDSNAVAADNSNTNPLRVQSVPAQRGIYIISLASLPANGMATDAWMRFWPAPNPGGFAENPFSGSAIQIARALNPTAWSELANWNTSNGDNPLNAPGGGALDFDIPNQVSGNFVADSTALADPNTANPVIAFRNSMSLASMVNLARSLNQSTLVLRMKWSSEVGNTAFYKHASAEEASQSSFYVPKLIVQMEDLPGTFTYISPPNGSTGRSTCGVTLSWNAASGATGYDVYFGLSGNPPLIVSNQAGTTYATGVLLPGRTYFWKIVARNASGTIEGPVWSFTTEAAIIPVIVPTPADGATGVAIDPVFNFNELSAATPTYNLYIWKVGDPIPATPIVVGFTPGGQISDSLTIFPWQYSTQYRWKIDSVYDCQTVTSAIFTFTTAAAGGSVPGVPTNPNPGAPVTCSTDVSISTTGISWTNGANTDQIVIDIQEGDPGLLFGGLGGTFYDPAVSTVTFASEGITLQYGHTYYAQVIAINAFGQTAGPVWCFIVEDAPTSPPEDRSNRRYFRQYRFNRRQRV